MINKKRQEYDITAKDGVSSKITVFTGYASSTAPALVCMPAMGVAAKFYEPLAVPILASGYRFVTADLRGNGHSSVRASKKTNFGYHEMVTFDWPAVTKKVQELLPNAPIYLFGHSLGGQLSALYLGANPDAAAGLILIAAPSVYFRGWNFPVSLGVLAGTVTACVVARFLGYFPGKKFGFGGREARGVICDWARQGRTGRYEPQHSTLDFEMLLGQLKHPVLALSFEGDFLAPERAVKNLCDKMQKAPLTHIHLRGENLGHLQWVRNPEPVIWKIREWPDMI